MMKGYLETKLLHLSIVLHSLRFIYQTAKHTKGTWKNNETSKRKRKIYKSGQANGKITRSRVNGNCIVSDSKKQDSCYGSSA